ncbi:unnamed protein product [Schistosoma rodhaini]|uniref:Uncharacterized protein n=1 Tax=Schistosoma rodhaini TaxID=6188 RepID=A0AA85GE54_9TREM|nr:unnamed protein product [Schistosoma rodhaini]
MHLTRLLFELVMWIIYLILWNLNMIKCNQGIGMKKLRLQSLDIEFCLPIGDSFCTELVPNSFCSTEKNECFCKYGHYSIQEDDGIICKTLLTNDKCQLDSDCIYVKNSICHPGAGACICPSGTIYIPEEQACRFQIKTFTNDYCDKCQRFHGLCYRNEEDQGIIQKFALAYSQFNERIPYRCKCPYNAVSINTNLLWNRSYINQSQKLVSINDIQILDSMNKKENIGFCRGLLVDIGMFCNQIDMLCRSSNAFCSNGKIINNVYLSPQCVCQNGYLPVYQDYLDYYECIPVCNRCYSIEQYPRQKHCVCSEIVQQNRIRKVYEISKNIQDNIFNFSRTQQNFTICFHPFMVDHQSSIFMRNTNITHFIVFISNQFNSLYPYDACLLSMFKEGIWCKTLNVSKNDDILTRCASIQFDHKKKELTFKTYIIVLYQSVFDYIIKDIQYFISFTSYWNGENITLDSKEIKMINRNYTRRNHSETLDKLHQNLNFTMKNNLNTEYPQTVINARESVHLHVEYYFQNNSYTYISIEQCSISQTSPFVKSDEIIFVRKNCLIYSPESINEIKFHSNDLSTYGNFTIPLNKYTSVSSMKSLTEADSSQLNSDLMGNDSNKNFTVTSELHINCVFRVCQHIRWCVWPSYCNGHMRSLDHDLNQSDLSWSYTYPSILTLTKSLKIKIPNSNSISPSLYSSSHSPAFKQNKSINSICEPNNIFIKFSTHFMIFIICIVIGIIFTMFYYHYNSLTCQTPNNQFCRTFHPSNHKKCTNNQCVTYNLCSNPLNTKVLQSPVDKADTSDHSLNSILQENFHQLHQYSSLKYLESNCSMITQHDLIHHKKDYPDHDQFDLNKNYKLRLSSSTDLQQQQQQWQQQKSTLVPYCLHNQTLYFLQSDWNNIDKQENSFKSINTTDYTYFNNHFYDLSNSVKVKTDLCNHNYDEQEFNV